MEIATNASPFSLPRSRNWARIGLLLGGISQVVVVLEFQYLSIPPLPAPSAVFSPLDRLFAIFSPLLLFPYRSYFVSATRRHSNSAVHKMLQCRHLENEMLLDTLQCTGTPGAILPSCGDVGSSWTGGRSKRKENKNRSNETSEYHGPCVWHHSSYLPLAHQVVAMTLGLPRLTLLPSTVGPSLKRRNCEFD